jgi:hypothetical protein
MPKVDHLAKLLHAVAAQNWASARDIGAQMAAAEEEIGHHSAAQLLRGALHPNGHASVSPAPNGSAWMGDPGSLAAALTRLGGSPRLDDVALRSKHRREMMTLVNEWRHRDALR